MDAHFAFASDAADVVVVGAEPERAAESGVMRRTSILVCGLLTSKWVDDLVSFLGDGPDHEAYRFFLLVP